MDSSAQIKSFLDRVRKQRKGIYLLQGLLRVLALVLLGALTANLIAYFSDHPQLYLVPFLIAWGSLLGITLLYLAARGLFAKDPPSRTALWVENRVENLDNALISSVQLEPQLKERPGEGVSQEMIRELIRRTSERIQNIRINELISKTPLSRTGQWTVGVFLVALACALILPDFWTRGYDHWIQPPALARVEKDPSPTQKAPPAVEEIQYRIEELGLTFHYPAYTRKKTTHQKPSNGKIRVLPGTEILLRGKTNHPVDGASLVLNGQDHFSMSVKDQTALEGRFIAKEPGFYQFRLKSPKGKKTLLPRKYPVRLLKDRSPRIIIFLANPKPVYYLTNTIRFFYEASDDFGLRKIDLVIDVEGRIERKTIKRIKGHRQGIKGDYSWELATMNFQPGDRVQYYLEVADNDNVSGPNTAQSEVFSFEVFDEHKKRLDLLALQEELVDRMVGLLAQSLVTDTRAMKASPEGLVKLKRTLASSVDQLTEIISMAQSIQAQAQDIESFPQPYLTLLENVSTGLNEIRQDQIDAMNRITNAQVRATPIGLNFPPVETVQERLITHLEQDIIFLVKILNRERMNQVMNLDQSLTELTESLREEFHKAKNKKGKLDTPQFKAALRKMKETLQKIMEQLARKQQGLSDEFLNPNAFENMNLEGFSASLEKLMDLVNQGKIDQAMEELEKLADDLRAFSNQLEDINSSQENLVDLQIMKKLEEARDKIEKLEKDQTRLLNKTTQLNKELRSKQSKKFENRLKELFESLRKDVQAIQSILHKDEDLLENHPDMKKLIALMEKHEKISEQIRELNQSTIDSVGNLKIRKNFQKLNEARQKLTENLEQQLALKMKMFFGFKNFLPEYLEKYNKLEELTELMDLYEFDSLFKKIYPDAFRWQNHFRTARKANPELLEQMKKDILTITQINSEISKKLGTLMRDIRQDYQNLITQKDQQDLQSMADQQKKMRGETGKLSQMFQEMMQQNPMISPMFTFQMDSSGRHMKNAEGHLQKSRVPESIESENRALKQLSETRQMLEQLKEASRRPNQSRRQRTLRLGQGQSPDNKRGGNSTRMQQEKVHLPSEDQYKVPGQFRDEILKAMKNKYPKKYERLIGEYYKELVK